MARGILLGTSIWICYLRPHGWDDLKMAVQQVLTVEQVYTCWVVMAELLIGARDERGFTQLSKPCVPCRRFSSRTASGKRQPA